MAGPVAAGQDAGRLRRFLAFRVSGRFYALAADEVGEVIRLPAIAKVPQSPPGLLGLANLRGAVIPVASGSGLLGQDESGSFSRAVVLENDPPVALAVDGVDGLVEVPAERVGTEAGAVLPGEALRGAFQNGSGDLVKILDLAPLLASAFTMRASRASISRTGAAQPLVQPASVARTRLLTFEVAGQEYGLALDSVQEIADAPAGVTGIPHSESLVLGVMGLREQLLPLLSLRGLLGLGNARPDRQKIIVTRVKGELVGLVADRMTGIEAAPDAEIEDMPEMLAARLKAESRIRSIYRAEGGRRLIPILTTDDVFDDEIMRKLGAARKSVPAPPSPKVLAALAHFVVFRLGDEAFGLPIASVEQVLNLPGKIARLPRTPKFLEGIINLHGEVLPVIDQRRRFGLASDDTLAARKLVVVRTQSHRAGLIVDSVSEILRTAEDGIAPAPALAGEANPQVRGAVGMEGSGELVLLLDPAELLTRAEQGILEKFARQAAEQPKT